MTTTQHLGKYYLLTFTSQWSTDHKIYTHRYHEYNLVLVPKSRTPQNGIMSSSMREKNTPVFPFSKFIVVRHMRTKHKFKCLLIIL